MVSKFGLSFTSGIIPWIHNFKLAAVLRLTLSVVPSQRSQPCGRWFLQWFPPPCRRPSRQPGVFENRYHCNQLIRGDALRMPSLFSNRLWAAFPPVTLRQMDRVKA